MSISTCVLTLALLSSLQMQVLAQALPYGVPVTYSNDDDDIGMLLAILLLATKNRGCNCCNCCNGAQTIPIPYPIPIPTNNPVIYNRCQNSDEDPEDKPRISVNKGGGGNTVDVDVTKLIT